MRGTGRPAVAWVLGVLAFALAAFGARPYAGGYNDGSRLATAESLIERGTLCIDESVFVHAPDDLVARGHPPYSIGWVNQVGTLDKVRIGGRFYSDKPMVPSVLLAGAYRALMPLGLPRPAERPDVFCRIAAILTCGLPFAVAVGCMWALGARAGLPPGWRLVWLAGFALATVLPAYTRQVNSGAPQLGALAVLALLLARAAEPGGRTRWLALLGAGCAAGFGYTLDLGSGPPLLALAALAVAARTRRIGPVAVFLLGALPWVVANHALLFAVGRVWVPLGMVPEYLDWPGSPFSRANMTGVARHTAASFLLYAGELLFNLNGFLLNNLALMLAAACGWLVLLKPGPARIELAALSGWCVCVWVVYAVLSDNHGGGCTSVRWFVPFLVPGFWLLARLLAERPSFRADFAILSGFGLVLGYRMWDIGPWLSGPVEGQGAIAGGAVAAWVTVRAGWMARGAGRIQPGRLTPAVRPDR